MPNVRSCMARWKTRCANAPAWQTLHLDAQCENKAYAISAVGKLCEMVLSLREIYYGREAGPIMVRS
jgi:hypothetical protein